ncbi:Acyl-CoA dehydrogenase [Paraburkholderia domus]|jgi:Acyl-CoA dehydrogenases|uniref:Acyl-CoA dehydrogenase n=1 Tax=Paraburkholderia domus TaxID=2793075 RepID=A0A9N8MQE2_9BURK|nr:acyl-CoA dehydrogenase [Paraburkholderia domus]MBK5051458.1 acyl-CoA dehydrogenase family protein [Burkholderia sp. R-70006]MBK5063689.1 acyl-CoA dehydrogenase family protein [Burkholderia sp. R-70199]MBK5089710.1 acyl-CoA dehydrogenase family protein [Burkholderia sp. R-69927]MBK5122825.1 acyl-CoA dehydrogenase family protein [Burkholderia sp. R-69980]MBK5165307.1 acyl-CoA dehydrogenase family protein [Burkholderia sp. R-70211]MBK5182763.1 acyl-CoA dehydrogenase family protein [Burkholder
MNFQHTEDRRMLADSLNRFIAEQYPFNVRDRIAQSDEGFSRDVWKRFCELGIVGAFFDESVGGFGGDGFDIAVVFEALGRGLVVEPFLDALIVGQALARAGNEAQRGIVAALIDGAAIAAFAHVEPGSHYEPARVATRAVRNDQGWVLRGAKGVVLQAEQADVLLVSARTSGEEHDEAGISLFLVPRNASGVKLRGYRRIDGGRAAEVLLDDVALDADALVGEEGNGYATLTLAVGYGLVALASEAVGAMDVAKEHTLDYLRTRKQFGVPIGTFQALQHRMADLLLNIEQARSAAINAAAAVAEEGVERERALSAAKYSIGQIGARVAEEAIQLHGGIGMTWELPLSRYAKRLVMIDHQLGDEDHHLARYVEMSSALAG